MSRYRKIFNRVFAFLSFIALLSFTNNIYAQNGEALFKANCASCHKPDKDFTGPALKGARDREPDKEWAYKWVNNVNAMLETDAYAKKLLAEKGSRMQQLVPSQHDLESNYTSYSITQPSVEIVTNKIVS